MTNVANHSRFYAEVVARTIEDMFCVPATVKDGVQENNSVDTERRFFVSLYFTGTVYGEYILALDESTAARIIGMDGGDASEYRDDICDAMTETLNTIVGESIIDLQSTHAKLTLTAPRIYFGEIRYPQFKTGKVIVESEAGEIECHFCLDLMRLDLATSYNEAMQSLVQVNSQLKAANRHLADQQAHLVHTEKMASVGVLASGVAHEINSPLFFVDANLETLCDYMKVFDSALGLYETLAESMALQGECVKELTSLRAETQGHDLPFVLDDTKALVEETREGVHRIKSIVQGLKDFSQVKKAGNSETELIEVTENTLTLITPQLPEGSQVVRELSPLPPVLCNAGEIGHALSGVLLNAGQAIEGGGTVTVRSGTTDANVWLTVEDDGVGIPAENIEHVFEPFFTTREVGEGKGLGLSIAYGIFERHHGSISVESEVGNGTKVTMRLPLVCVDQEAKEECVG